MYFTKLKTLIDELNTYHPGCTCGACRCGGIREMVDYLQTEYLMDFLMGLNEFFSRARAQLLLMDLIPTVSKAFPLLLQEEQQWSIGSFSTLPSIATLAVVTLNNFKNVPSNKQPLFVLIATVLNTLLICITRFMVILQDIKQNSNNVQAIISTYKVLLSMQQIL